MINSWGFWNFMVPFGIVILWFLTDGIIKCCSINPTRADVFFERCAVLLLLSLGVSYFVHFVWMAVLRFRHAGRVCSGDYDSDLSLWNFNSQAPYQHKTGTWLFYNLATQVYAVLIAITGVSFTNGLSN